MSERIHFRWRAAVLAVGIVLLVASSLLAQQPAVLSIDYGEGGPGDVIGVFVELETYQTSFSAGSFEILIGYDSTILSVVNVEPGPAISQCAWESFGFDIEANPNQTDTLDPYRPNSLLRIAAVADIDNGDIHPSCYLSGFGGCVAIPRFRILPGTPYPSQTPLRFYWSDCGANIIATAAGDSLLLAHEVTDFDSSACFPTPVGLPSVFGIPDLCLGTMGDSAFRLVDFHDGIVFVNRLNVLRGDLNLNGIANEVSDLIRFMNYFFYGLVAFDPINREEQIAASDINADGMVLTFQDFTFLYRIVIGDAPPFPKSADSNVAAVVTQDTACKSISVSCPNSLAALYLCFQGRVEPWTFAWQASFLNTVKYDSLSNRTMIMLFCPNSSASCGGNVFRYDGSGVIQQAAAGDWLDSYISVTAVVASPTDDCGDFDGSGNLDIGDVVYLIRYIFSGGTAPLDSRHGDVTCDGVSDISDVVYLLNYIFAGGLPPCGLTR